MATCGGTSYRHRRTLAEPVRYGDTGRLHESAYTSRVRTVSRAGVQRWALLSASLVLVALITVVVIGNNQELAPPTVDVSDASVALRTGATLIQMRQEEIISVSLEPHLPRMQRIAGWNSRAALRGSFWMDGGAAYVHVSRRHPPYIVIRGTDQTVIVNYSDESRTRALFEQIMGNRRAVGQSTKARDVPPRESP